MPVAGMLHRCVIHILFLSMQFLFHFSQSFILALILWPTFSMLLTTPFIFARLIRRRRIIWSYVLGSYLLVLYGVGLLCFTLYPMPDDPTAYCTAHNIQPQLIPFHWIADMLHESIRIVAEQLIANIIFFIPLGALVFIYFRKPFSSALIWGFVFSIGIEIAQLTGNYGLYPCGYRLFDVDDLVMNTLGAIVGFLLAKVIGYQIGQPPFSAPAAKNTFFNRFLAWCLNVFFVLFFSLISQFVLTQFTSTRHFGYVVIPWTVLLTLIIPRFTRHKVSIGRYLVGVYREEK